MNSLFSRGAKMYDPQRAMTFFAINLISTVLNALFQIRFIVMNDFLSSIKETHNEILNQRK